MNEADLHYPPDVCPFCNIAAAFPCPESSLWSSRAENLGRCVPGEEEANYEKTSPSSFVVLRSRDVVAFLDILPMTGGVTDYNIVQNNGARAAQVVPHVHFHIIPRPGTMPEIRNKSWTMFGRGQRDDLDDEEGAKLASEMRKVLREEVAKMKSGEKEANPLKPSQHYKNMAMNSNSNDAPSSSDGHLVYTALRDGTITLNIHISGSCTTKHLCNVFFLDQQTGNINFEPSSQSAPPAMLQEHGLFTDIDRFADICLKQRVPNQGDDTFKAWRSQVLSVIKEECGAQWAPYKN
ncbi:hypothetical protein N0V83_006970 [Neocucurbitaria cava]|uniref:HIT domain-containing protein n=1 Tax=Neocucurbitaria cava TaxID=798079 RepID=A0A9W8Y4H8_9PLEO|nr:hypothetical protein N0V83_006970 [Neocucurbitaria cava]